MTVSPCVVLDIDDTLYLERDYVRSGFSEVAELVAREIGTEGFERVAWDLFERGERGSIFDRALELLGCEHDVQVIARLVDHYRAHVPSISLLPDSLEFLDSAAGLAQIAYVTDGPRTSQRNKIDALGLLRWSRLAIVTDELGPGFGKPSPRPFQLVEQQYAGCAGRFVYIADNPLKDFAGPKSLGWTTIRIIREGGLHSAVPSGADVDREQSTLRDLLQLVTMPFDHSPDA